MGYDDVGRHLCLLARWQNDVFEEAISRALRDNAGAHVLDIGTGTGLLAMMAARAGAQQVTAIEV